VSAQQTLATTCFPVNTTRILPNPFNRQVTVIINTPNAIGNMGVVVSDAIGRTVYSKVVNKPAGYFSVAINSSGWMDGIYSIKLLDGSKRIFVQQLLKRP
jgi:hypothetical protein